MSYDKAINHSENGYNVECTHSGQKRRYGDIFREFTVKSSQPECEVKIYCTSFVCPCALATEEYLRDEREGVKDFGDHFRANYAFSKVKDGEYFYRVINPSTC